MHKILLLCVIVFRWRRDDETTSFTFNPTQSPYAKKIATYSYHTYFYCPLNNFFVHFSRETHPYQKHERKNTTTKKKSNSSKRHNYHASIKMDRDKTPIGSTNSTPNSFTLESWI